MNKLLLIVCLFSFCFVVQAKKAKRFVLNCATDDFAPYSYIKKSKGKTKLVGVEVDLFYEALKRLGIEGTLKVLPWKRMMYEVKEGSIDCMFAAFWTPERKEFMNFTHVPFHVSRLVIYVNKKNPFKFTDIKDFHGKSFALPNGFKTSLQFDSLIKAKKVNVREVRLMENALKMLNKGRVDAVISNNLVAQEIINSSKLTNIIGLPKPLTANSGFLGFSKKGKGAHLAPDFDAVLFDIFSDGTYSRFLKDQK